MQCVTSTSSISLTLLHALLVVLVYTSLFTTTQSRVVLINNNNNNNNNNRDSNLNTDGSSSSSNSGGTSSEATVTEAPSTLGDLKTDQTEDFSPDFEDMSTAKNDENGNDDDGDDDDDNYDDDDFEDDYSVWPVLCPPNNFYSLEKDECVTCTPCPSGTYTVTSCHRFQDNLCIAVPSLNSGVDGKISQSSSSRNSNDDNNNKLSPHYKNPYQDRIPPPKSIVSDKNSVEWKSVSLTLLIFTSVIFLCLVTVGSIFFYMRRRARQSETTKEIVCSYSPAPRLPPIVKVAKV